MIDRIDMHLEVAGLDYGEMSSRIKGESSKAIKARVDLTRGLQEKRFAAIPGVYCNSQMSTKLMEKHCVLDTPSAQILERSVARLGLSARAYHRILKISRTIADMDASQAIGSMHVSEAVQFCRSVQ